MTVFNYDTAAGSPFLYDPSDSTTAFNVGDIKKILADAIPAGWLLCNGTAVSRTAYAALFAILGTTHGAGDGTTTFNLPNLKGKVPVGKDTAQTEFATIGQTGGEKTHKLTVTEMPNHSHTAGQRGASDTNSNINNLHCGVGGTGGAVASTGGDGAHNNLQPYIVVNYVIKY
jgi:microcystin-dependent protein